MPRQLTFAQALLEATDQCLSHDPAVYLMGLGVSDPKGIFGTTLGLQKKYGDRRVMDMPVSENAMTGVAIGSAISGSRPILTHQRVDFALLSLDQIINNAAKWHYMFDGKMKVPLVIRMIVGRGWGQGPQHSQSLHAVFAHIPGLKVVMPTTPHDAKGLMISSVEDDNPVIFIEHRWLHGIVGFVPEEMYRVPIGKARIVRPGSDITIVTNSYMVLEASRSADLLEAEGIQAEVIDVRTINPLDRDSILNSVSKTGRLLVVDEGWPYFGFGAEIISTVAEQAGDRLKCRPRRLTLPNVPLPTSWVLSNHYYVRAMQIVNQSLAMLNKPGKTEEQFGVQYDVPQDVPDKSFTGPF